MHEVVGCMHAWDDWVGGWVDRWMGGWVDGWLGGLMDGWVGGWVGGMDGWVGARRVHGIYRTMVVG